MELLNLINDTKGDSRQITLETTVITGFEFSALEECKEKCIPLSITKSKGRIFFNIPESDFDKVQALRSVDNIFLVLDAQKGLQFEKDKDKDLETVKNIVDSVDWDSSLKTWASLVGFKGTLFPVVTPPKSKSEPGPDGDPAVSSITAGVEELSTEEQKPSEDGDKEANDILKFRVTCNRNGTHSFQSMDAARDFGGTLQDKFQWAVNLKNFDLNVILNIEEDTFYVCAAITRESKHRRNITHFSGTTLRSTMCYNLLRLTEPKEGDVIIDPLGGGGSISIEGCLGFPGTYHLCGDYSEKAVGRSVANMEYINKNEKRLYMDTLRWSAKKLPLRSESVDIFVTDLPFGKRSGKKSDNVGLYKSVIYELARVVRPTTGRAAILTNDKRAFQTAFGSYNQNPYWKSVRSFGVNQGGLFSCVFYLLRTSKRVGGH